MAAVMEFLSGDVSDAPFPGEHSPLEHMNGFSAGWEEQLSWAAYDGCQQCVETLVALVMDPVTLLEIAIESAVSGMKFGPMANRQNCAICVEIMQGALERLGKPRRAIAARAANAESPAGYEDG